MDLRCIILPVFLALAETENVTVVKKPLGQNATFTCSVGTTDTYWYIKISSQVKGLIARTFAMDDTLYFIYPETKYIAKGNVFEITNITAEDRRLYFCARKERGNMTFKDTFLLVTDDPITPSTNNSSEGNDHQQQNSCKMCQSDVVYSSLALNILLIFVIIGLVSTFLCLKRTKWNRQGTDLSFCIYENLQRKRCNRQGADPSSCIYENPETLETPQYKENQRRNFPPAVASAETAGLSCLQTPERKTKTNRLLVEPEENVET